MAYEINNVTIVGRLTRDPELKTVGDNVPLCNFSIANNPGKEDKDVSYFDVTAWNKTAEAVSKFMTKGSQIVVQGTLKQDRFQDKEGNNRSKVSINANNVQFVGGKSEPSNNSDEEIPF